MLSIDGVAGLAGWRWFVIQSKSRGPLLLKSLLFHNRLYIIEGLITVVWAACCGFLIPGDYQTAYFLTPEDKVLMRKRAEEMESYSGGSGHYASRDIVEAARDIKSWMHGFIQIAIITVLYGKYQPMRPVLISATRS